MARQQGSRTRQRQQLPEGRSKIWAAIRFLRRFTLEEIEQVSHEGRDHIRKYVARLQAAGYLRLVTKASGNGSVNSYQLIRNTGPQPPIPQFQSAAVWDPNTDTLHQEQRQPSTRDLAWAWMRQQGEFTSFELSERVGITRGNALKYLSALEKARYVRIIQPLVSGPGGHPAIYRLERNTGPLTPVVQRDGSIVDPNLKEVCHV